MTTISKQPFIKLLLRFGIIFLLVVTVIKILYSLIVNGGYEGMLNADFLEGKWRQFVKIQLVMSLIYGAFMAGYYKFIKK